MTDYLPLMLHMSGSISVGRLPYNRRLFFEELLVQDATIDRVDLKRVDVEKLLNMWQQYVEMPTENVRNYENLRKKFIDVFSEKVFDYYLNTTRVFHQTHWLIKNGFEDVQSGYYLIS